MTLLITLLVVFAGFTVQSAFGFGSAMVAVPFLTALYPVSVVTPLIALLSLLLSVGVCVRATDAIEKSLVVRLLASACIAAPLGTWLVLYMDAAMVRMVLGAVLVLASLNALNPYTPNIRVPDQSVWAFGFIAGIVGGAYGFFGLPPALFLQWRGLDPSKFRTSMHAFSIGVNIVILCSFWAYGALSMTVLQLGLWSAVPLCVGGWLGGYMVTRIDTQRYIRLLYCVLLVLGISLLVSSTNGT